jgi:hypothetical protein
MSDGSDMISQRYIRSNTSSTAISSSYDYIPTSSTIYYGLPYFNNSHTYTSSTSLYMPTSNPQTNGHVLISTGSGAPYWLSPTNTSYGYSTPSFSWASGASSIGPGFIAYRFQNYVVFNIGFKFSSSHSSWTTGSVGTISPAPSYEHDGMAVVDESTGGHNWYKITKNTGLIDLSFLQDTNSSVYFYISGAYTIN